MEYQRGRTGQPSRRGTETFTGETLQDEVLSSGSARVLSVFFGPGARTYWHSHSEGQVLFASHGKGMVETRGGERRVLQAGDTVYAPPGEEHWHGSAPDSFLMHTAVSLGRTEWLGEVPDGHYSAAWDETAHSRPE